MRVVRLEVSVYNIYIKNLFQTTTSKRKALKTFVPTKSKNSASGYTICTHTVYTVTASDDVMELFNWNPRRKIILIESNAKCRNLKKDL